MKWFVYTATRMMMQAKQFTCLQSVYKLSTKFCWFDDSKMIVKMFFINGMPFTFDELPFGHTWDEDLCQVADENPCYDPEYMYKAYGYLMLEELHPLYFPVELENPELLPDDLEYLYEQEESA